ncbi:cytochrome P450 [Lophiotrema nucula]|uniref:Cytochrome P450 n=1 Tax=Lophiotrema nucula TaxID=690887 RepID=A0A6A5ZIF5_9PLEO|nr:cytochrome P450 [Lophiotrema nucula]
MWSLLATSIFGTVAIFLFKRVRAWRVEAADIAFGRAKGCEPPPKLPYAWPLALDLIVNAFKAARSGHILQFFERAVAPVGHTFEQVLLGVSGIDTFDPQNIEAVLSSQFKEFGLGARRATFYPLLGDGIFTQDGSAWKHSRDLLRPQFLGNRAQNYTQMQEAVDKLIALIPDGQPVDLQPLFFRFTLETTTFLLFGKSIGALDDRYETGVAGKESEFAQAFTVSQDYLAERGRLGDLYWLIGGPKFWRACRTVHHFVDSMVQSRIGVKESVDSKYVFIDALLEETQDVFTIRSQVLNILLAGRDTTACCLTWTLRLLSRDQGVLSKLRAEIQDTIGSSPPTQQDLKRMPYLNYVLKEVLRLYPSVPVNSRTALTTTTLPTGGGKDRKSPILIRKGAAVGYCPYIMHRRKDLYGEDAYEFKPERWSEGFEKRIGWGYLPFNGGPRICLGQDFALLEASYAIVRLLQIFPSINPCAPPQPGKTEGQQTLRSKEIPGTERQHLTLVLSCAEGCWTRLKKQ